MTSYHIFERLMDLLPVEDHGVCMCLANFFFDRPLENLPDQYQRMREIEHCGVSHLSQELPWRNSQFTHIIGLGLQAQPQTRKATRC